MPDVLCRYGQSRVLGSGQRGGPVSAPGSNGHEMGPPNHSSEETESDERPRWREIMRAPRLDDPEEEPSNEADQDGTDLGQPDSIAGAATGPACDQLATRNQGPQGVPLVGPDDMTADDGVQGDAHLEGEPAVNSPEITGGPAATVGNGSPGGRQRRVVQPTGPEKGLAGGRSNGSWDNGNQERSTELQPGAAGGESDEEDSGNDRPPKRPRLDVAVAAVGPERQEPAGVGHGGSEVSRVAAASGSAATGNSNRLDGGSSDGARGDGSVPRPPAATGEGPAESSSGETGSEKSGDEGAPVHGLARAVAEASAAQVEGSGHAVTEAEGSESESQSSGDSSERTKRAAPTTAARGTGHVAGESSGSEGLSSGDSSVQTGANRADRRSTPRTKDTSAAVETVARDVVERTSSSDDSSDESASDEEAVEKGEGRALGAAAKEKAQSVRGNPEECADSEESPRTGEHAAAAAKQSTDSEESSDEEEPDTGQKGTATSARSGARGAEERGDVAAVESSGDEGSASDSEGSAQVNGDQSAGAGRTGETGTREGVEVERGGSGSESSEDESEEETLDGEEQPPSKGTPNGQAARTKSGVATGVPQAESTDEADSSEDDELDGDGAEAGRVAEDGRVNGRETAERHSNGGGGWGEKPGEVKESGSSSEEEDSEDESGSEGENEAAVATQVGRQLSETGKDGGQVSGQKRAKAATPDGTSEETSDSDDDERPDANATAPAGGVDEVQRHADTRAVESEKALRKTVATGSKATQSAAETSDSDDSASEAEDEVPAFKPDFSLNGVPSIGVLGGSDSDSDSGSESDVPRAESVTRETARREKGAAQGAPASRNGTPVRMIGVGDGPIQVPLNTAAAQDGGSDDSGESSSSDDSEESSSSDDSGDDTAFPQVPGEPPLPSFDLLRLSPALGPGASGEDSFHALLAQLWAKHVEAGSTHALHIQSVDTAGLARQPIRRFASLVAYVNSFRVWVLLEAWETIRAEYSAKKRSSKSEWPAPAFGL